MMSDFILVRGLGDQSYFERRLAERFPAISAEIEESARGLLHGEMAVFARATSEAIAAGHLGEVREHVMFVDELFINAASDLENAIYVSYLENAFLDLDPQDGALALLTPRLRAALTELEEHWKKNAEEWTRDQAR